jgi:N-acetylated-alpha-linked acidic dipeptidase
MNRHRLSARLHSMGMSCSGRMRAPLIYANLGRPEGFQCLEDNGVAVRGCIVLCRYSDSLRGLKVKTAQEAGSVGVILYNVPHEDGQFSSEDGYAVFPDGPARHLSAIQRGSVSFFSVGAGPYPEPAFTPSILSISISFRDARHLFDTLEGHGLGRSGPPPGWQGRFPGLDYYSGPSHMMLELVNDTEYIDTELYNVVGTIKGESSECVVRWLRGPSVWIHSNERGCPVT